MTTLTVKLDESLLKRTQEMAKARHATVDDVVVDALTELSKGLPKSDTYGSTSEERRRRIEAAFSKFAGIDTGGPYSRDEMNER
jgi:predicted transcriptional regulator